MAKLNPTLLLTAAIGLLAAAASADPARTSPRTARDAILSSQPSAGPLCDGTKKPESPPPPKEPKS